jgi:hypothetical protein
MAFSGDKSYFEPWRKQEIVGKRRVCAVCGKGLLPFQRTETMTQAGRSYVVHKKCKLRLLESRVPKA